MSGKNTTSNNRFMEDDFANNKKGSFDLRDRPYVRAKYDPRKKAGGGGGGHNHNNYNDHSSSSSDNGDRNGFISDKENNFHLIGDCLRKG